MKIAIWGYGKYGRRMLESLTNFCSDDYEVVRIYDAEYQKLKNTESRLQLEIHNPDDLLKDYQKGLFDKVLLCIFDNIASRVPKKLLEENSIPELHLGNPDNLYPVFCFEQGKKPFSIDREGYEFYVVRNLCGAMANYESDEVLYLFDDAGKVVKEHTDRFDLNREKAFFYDYPFVFKNSKAKKKLLKGQYCVLAKKHSGHNYWHFTYNSLDVVWILEKAGFQGKYVVPNAKFCGEILHMLGVSPERIIMLNAFEHNKIYIFEELFYIALRGAHEKYSTPVLVEAAEFIKKKLPVNPSLPKKIFVKRTGRRKLLGADNVIAEHGFTTVIPENYSVQEQMALFYNADIVFSVHGANSTNCLYMRKGTVFIEAFSSYWMKWFNLYAIAASGINYLPVSPLETVPINEDEMDGIYKDFEIPEVLLRTTILNALLINQAKNVTLSSTCSAGS